MVDLTGFLEAFVVTNDRSTFPYALASLQDQRDVKFEITVLRNLDHLIAYEAMVARSRSKFTLRVDDDLLLHPYSIDFIQKTVRRVGALDVAMVYWLLYEPWARGVIESLRVYQTEIARQVGFRQDGNGRVDPCFLIDARDGYRVVRNESILGIHACPEYEESVRYCRLRGEHHNTAQFQKRIDFFQTYVGQNPVDIKTQFQQSIAELNRVNQHFCTPFHISQKQIESPVAHLVRRSLGTIGMNRFIVLTTQRSGSTFFCKLLHHHPKICCMKECCKLDTKEQGTFRDFLTQGQIDFPKLSQTERRALLALFLDTITSEKSNIEASGFKLMYNQMEEIPDVRWWLEQRSLKVVHLVRRNQLKRLVSWIVMMHGGRTFRADKPLYQNRVQVSCEGLVDLLTDMEAQVNAHRKHFSNRFPYLEVFYEDLVTSQEQEVDRVGGFLGIGPLGQLQSELVKVNSDALRDIVVNYNEVAATLQDTPFERFLDSGCVSF